MKKGLVVMCVAILGVAGLAATLRVPTDYATIQAAVDAANPGDEIVVAPGTYDEIVDITSKTDITIRGDVTVTVPEGSECCGTRLAKVSDQMAVVITQINIFDSKNITLQYLTLSGGKYGIYVQGSKSSPVTNLLIDHCLVLRNGDDGIHMTGHYKNVDIQCTAVDYNNSDGIDLGGAGADINIENCSVSYNGQKAATGVGIRVGALAKNVVIKANCIEGNAFAGIHPG